MAATNFTPIQIYYSTTAGSVPTAGNLLPGELGLNIADMKLYCENSSGVVTLLASAGGASGDVVGPASATDNAIARFDLTTGKLIQNSGITIDDSNNLTILGQADLRLADSDSSNWVAFQAPATVASNITFTLPDADGTNGQAITTNGSGTLGFSPVVSTSSSNTFTATQTFSGSSSVVAMVLNDAAETATISATAATGTINYDVTTQSVLYYTSNASANWTVNFRGSSGTSLNTLMSTGQSVTVAFLVTQGATAYYNNVVQVDGASVTPKYQGGTAWAAGNASAIDAYVYTIIKTGNAAFTVFASQTQFK